MSDVPTSSSRSDRSGRSDPFDILRLFQSDRLVTSSGRTDQHVIVSPTGPTRGTTTRTDKSVHKQRGPTRPSGPSKHTGWMAKAKLTVPDSEIANPNSCPHGTSIAGNRLTWTDKDVSLDDWRRLSDWERHGSSGKLWNARSRQWEGPDGK